MLAFSEHGTSSEQLEVNDTGAMKSLSLVQAVTGK